MARKAWQQADMVAMLARSRELRDHISIPYRSWREQELG